MGISRRSTSRPRRQPTTNSPLSASAKKTVRAAMDARAHGLLSEVGLDHIADGKVDSKDLKRAERILEKAEDVLHEVECDDNSLRRHVNAAEERVDVAQALFDAVGDQLAEQRGNRPRRTRSRK